MAMTLITTNTSSNASASAFTSSIDSTYKLYIFKFIDINPATDGANFTFQANATDTADYNDIPMTTTYFRPYHTESDSAASLDYITDSDQAQGTGFQIIQESVANDADGPCAGVLHLFSPSSTTYVKHFYSRINGMGDGALTSDVFVGGYFNDTTAIDDVQFKMSSGNFDGVIQMYGIA